VAGRIKSCKNPNDPTGIQHITFRLVALCLDHLRHCVPSQISTYHQKSVRTITNQHVPSQISTYHHKSARAITNQHVPSQISTYHHKSARAITNQHVPSQISTYHQKSFPKANCCRSPSITTNQPAFFLTHKNLWRK
jgi:hypothetical protein